MQITPRGFVKNALRLSVLGSPHDDVQLRRRFGDAGRSRVREEFTWNVVIQRFYELWEEQCDLCAAFETGRTARPWVSYQHLYSHFASCSRSRETGVVCEDPSGTLERLRRYPNRYPSTRMRQEAAQMVRRSGVFSVRLSELSGDESVSSDAVAWLAKRGFCRLIHSPVQTQVVEEPETTARSL